VDCPKCSNMLVERTRAGVAIDICSGCSGVWLDRGELDKLLDRERRNNGDRNGDDDDDDGPGGFLQNLIDLFNR
jgi:Zn-finger nucleic acid-binding protein